MGVAPLPVVVAPDVVYTLMELNSQYALVKALGLLATYSWHVLAKALQVVSASQTAALPAQSPQKVVSYSLSHVSHPCLIKAAKFGKEREKRNV